MRLLLAEDDRIVRITVRDALEEAGFAVTACADGSEAMAALEREGWDILLTDVRLPGVDGLALFRRIRLLQPDAGVILMTAYADTEDAVAVMREGARDYLLKPFEMEELLLRVGRVRDELRVRRSAHGSEESDGGALLGEAPSMRLLRDRMEAAAASDVAVLVTGETGTGKDLCARITHERSRRAGRPFVVVNCAAIPETLFEAELFGHEKGAFTGADRRRVGRFAAADGGTLFLDEVGDLAPSSQAKLLRSLESSSFEPVGSSETVRVDVRVVAATNHDLSADIARGLFRKDLFYRLNVIDLHAPPLRERRSDLPLLVGAFLKQIAVRQGRPVPDLEPAAVAALAAHDYPGNVRELQHALERAVALARGSAIGLEHLPVDIAAGTSTAARPEGGAGEFQPLDRAVAAFEHEYVQRALARAGGHRTRAAALLGISRKSLWERLREVSRARGQPGER
ncbi:MAG TPA: sigma-54 dependent transcriptional regulator [Anaeromyxobacteraceae bacterium]|nr:sigma-54 dependent transcriptional regulator [Anaeromyxobacteraceae bacterium]